MSTSSTTPSSRTMALALAAIIAVALILALGAGGGGGVSADGPQGAFGTPTVSGAPLVPMTDPATDPAVGVAAPLLSGESTDGEPLTIGEPGTPTIVAFVAHWCSHCQAEVPVVVDWVEAGNLPDDVRLVAVATDTDEGQPNFPPAAWLADEGWTAPVLLDDELNTAGDAFGVSSFPFWAVLGADGTVLLRMTGELAPDTLDALVEVARAG